MAIVNKQETTAIINIREEGRTKDATNLVEMT